ncbi:hypothetical protein WJX82_006509 [Trebouxia sp. C0006]
MSLSLPKEPPPDEALPVETAVLLPSKQARSASMAPVLPVSGPGRSPPRTTSWSVHSGLLDVEAQSVAGSSETSAKLNNDDQILSRSVSDATEPTSTVKPSRHYFGGSRYVEKYLFAGVWACLLMCGYASARISAHLRIPPDASTNGQDPFDTFQDISQMLQFGFLLGWFVGVFEAERFAYLFHWRRIYWIAIFIGTPPVYAAISRIPALQHKHTPREAFSPTSAAESPFRCFT